jgi:hypothetical protein
MATIAEIRQKYPQYNDLSDTQLADAFHGRFYSDIPKQDFYKTLGVTSAGPKAPEAPKKSGSLLQTIDDAVRGVADTVTFGFADEIAAGADRLFGINTGKQGTAPQSYNEALAAQRQRDAEGGGARLAGQVAGAVLPISQGANLVKQGLTAAKVAPTAMKVATGTGALTGGIYGVGSAEGDLAERAVGGAQGAATGAVLGPVVQKGFDAGGKVVDLAKNVAGVKTPVTKLPTQVQQTIQEVAPGTTAVSPKAAKALEKLSSNPQSVASDLRVRDLFLAEKARVIGADPQRAIPDDEVFKNVGDKLKFKATSTVDALRKAGEIDAEASKELKTIVSRAARHNRAITGNIKDEELAAELARGFKTDDSIIDGLSLSREGKRVLKDAIKDLDTVTFNSLKKNSAGPFEMLGTRGGTILGTSVGGATGGIPGAIVGATTGPLVGKVAGKVGSAVDSLFDLNTAPVLQRNIQRIASGLDEAGVKAGDTVKGLEDLAQKATASARAKQQAMQAQEAAQKAQGLAIRNRVLAQTRVPLGGPFQELLAGGRAGTNLPTRQAVEALRLLRGQGGPVGDAAEQILKSRNVSDPNAFYGLQTQLRKLQESGAVPGSPMASQAASSGVRNPISYAEAVRTAGEAANLARSAAPSKELGMFATRVAKTTKPEDKAKLVSERLSKATDQAELDYLNQFVVPLTQFGAKGK